MQLISAKCPDCGADIKIPEGNTTLVCEYCGGNILVTDVLGSTSVMQNCMMLAFSAMESGNYKDAYDHFNRAIEIDLKNPNAWFGKAVCTGLTGKFSDDVFGKMINLFENAFNYAPVDKKSNLKKNAAAEIVKVIRKSSTRIKFACDLISFKVDAEFSSIVSDELTKFKETVIKTVQKAVGYDPANKEVTELLDEIISGKFFTPEQENQKETKEILYSGENKLVTAETSPPPLVITDQTNASQGAGSNKKGGCSIVLIILILVMVSTVLLVDFFIF
jgi:DNA-directed RNA polymerase subunit RPC12/RpoP